MNVISRGVKNAIRSPLRSGAIVIMLAISIGLILSMLVARSSVNARIDEVKSTAGTNITISPAGVRGFAGGGNPLTSDQLAKITSTAHIISTTSSLSDQLGSTDTNLVSSLNLGSFGRRQQRFDSNGATSDSENIPQTASRPAMTPRVMVTGTTDPNSISTDGSSLNITNGQTINGASSDLVAIVGSDLATKNNLAVNSTFTAYTKTITVEGIYKTSNTFQDSGLVMPLATLQTLTSQAGAISSVTATVDSSDNVDATVASLKTALGDAADITSQAKQAADSVASLESIASLAFAGVIGATIAGAVIVLVAMIIIVRERRREIGVIKAIGGSNGKVITQFVTEALTLTILGAFLGLILGVLVSGPMTTSLVSSSSSNQSSKQIGANDFIRGSFNQISKNITGVTASLTPEVFTSAIGITILIAIIGSAGPAWFIARIRPAEILRTE